MESLKSLASFWCDLALALQQEEMATWLSINDLDTVRKRSTVSKIEGQRFLCAELPALAKDVYRSFKSNRLVVTAPFQLARGRAYPVFLRGLFSLIYERDGTLKYEKVKPVYIKLLLQLLGIFYKLESDEVDPTKSDLVKAKFIATQSRIANQPPFSGLPLEKGFQMDQARRLVWRLLEGDCPNSRRLDPYDIRPRHGSGATACRTSQKRKWNDIPRYSEKMHKTFPFTEYMFLSPSALADVPFNICETGFSEFEQLARVTFVPKNFDGPRLISMEPKESQYIQQGIMRALYNYVEKHPMTSGRVNFTNQNINRELAKEASIFGHFATLDLSEASDSVSTELVNYLFPPKWAEVLNASRSDATQFPDGSIVKLNSFAPMGSAVCFPIEAICFWAIATACSNMGSKIPIRVYGDDIICDTDDVDSIVSLFADCGLVVNEGKSYSTGFFRESCGADYFHGYDVTVVRLRSMFKKTALSKISNIQTINQLVEKFDFKSLWQLSRYVEDIHGIIPRVPGSEEPTFFNFGDTSVNFAFKYRWNEFYQILERRVRGIRSVKIDTKYDGWGEVTRNIVGRDCWLRRGVYTDRNSVKESWVWKELRCD